LGTYFAKVVEIPECIAEGKTPEDTLELLNVSLKFYFKNAIANGRTIPAPAEGK
jgi:predicted RNase H-like HicB family nuclease